MIITLVAERRGLPSRLRGAGLQQTLYSPAQARLGPFLHRVALLRQPEREGGCDEGAFLAEPPSLLANVLKATRGAQARSCTLAPAFAQVQKSASHYTAAAYDEIEILRQIQEGGPEGGERLCPGDRSLPLRDSPPSSPLALHDECIRLHSAWGKYTAPWSRWALASKQAAPQVVCALSH